MEKSETEKETQLEKCMYLHVLIRLYNDLCLYVGLRVDEVSVCAAYG